MSIVLIKLVFFHTDGLRATLFETINPAGIRVHTYVRIRVEMRFTNINLFYKIVILIKSLNPVSKKKKYTKISRGEG